MVPSRDDGDGVIWLRLPDGWPQPLAAAVTLLLLTALDVAGTVAAKEAVERRSADALWFAAVGAFVFVLMFWVFASCLRYTGLVVVTVGWCVLVQVAVLFLDRLHYGAALPPGKLLAVALAVAAQVYLVAGPSRAAPGDPAAAVRSPAGSSPATPTMTLGQLLEQTATSRPGTDGEVRPGRGRHLASADPAPLFSQPERDSRAARHVASQARPSHARRRGPGPASATAVLSKGGPR